MKGLRAAMKVKVHKGGGPVGERKGKNNAGVRTGSLNTAYDNHHPMSRTGTAGSKSDRGRGRW